MGPYLVFILLNTGSLLGVYSHTFGSLIKLAAVAYCSSGKTTHGRGLADSRYIFPHVSGPLSCRSTMDCLPWSWSYYGDWSSYTEREIKK